MDLPNKSDSAVPKPEGKNIKPVIQGAVHVPRPATRRFLDFLFAESPKAIAAKIGREVMVPRAKAAVEEAGRSFLHGMLWGNGSNPLQGMINSSPMMRLGGTNYQQISSGGITPATAALMANQARPQSDYQDITCPTQEAAELLLANMYDLFNRYRVVTVADLYELAGFSPQPSQGNYGWMSMDGARITQNREGFVLQFPRPSLI